MTLRTTFGRWPLAPFSLAFSPSLLFGYHEGSSFALPPWCSASAHALSHGTSWPRTEASENMNKITFPPLKYFPRYLIMAMKTWLTDREVSIISKFAKEEKIGMDLETFIDGWSKSSIIFQTKWWRGNQGSIWWGWEEGVYTTASKSPQSPKDN